MEFLNLHTSILDHEILATAEDVPRSAWLHLMRYCIGQENGGCISGAKTWSEKKWMLLCRVAPETLQMASQLWTWDGDDLLVWGYPKDKQREIKAKRRAAQEANAKRWAERPHSEALSDSATQSGREGKGREYKERKGREGSDIAEAIYQAYPKHVAKADALKAIRTVIATRDPAELLACVQAYATAVASWPADRQQFVPHPATWFRRGSFDDDPAAWKNSANPPRAAAAPAESQVVYNTDLQKAGKYAN